MHTVSNLSANSCTAAIMPCAWGILVDGLLICPGYIPRNLSANFLHKLYKSRLSYFHRIQPTYNQSNQAILTINHYSESIEDVKIEELCVKALTLTRGDLMKAGAGGSPGLVKEVALVLTCPVCTAAQHRDRENDLPASRGGSLEVDNIIYYKRQCASSRNLEFRAWCF